MKGPSVLSLHPVFKMTSDVIIDDLHGLYHSVARTLASYWFYKGNKNCYFYIGNTVSWVLSFVCTLYVLHVNVFNNV